MLEIVVSFDSLARFCAFATTYDSQLMINAVTGRVKKRFVCPVTRIIRSHKSSGQVPVNAGTVHVEFRTKADVR